MYIFFFSRGTQKLTLLTMKLMDTKEKKLSIKLRYIYAFFFLQPP